MSAEKMTDEKTTLGQLRMTEALYVLMSDFTRMPFVECSEENYDDEVFVYFQEEDAKKEAERRCEKNEKSTRCEDRLQVFASVLYKACFRWESLFRTVKPKRKKKTSHSQRCG